jgi:8-oxo-dGTP diphosphatase
MIKVAAAFLIHDEKVLIARRKTPPRLAGKWEFPGGKLEAGETPETCLAREIEEEFSIRIRVGAFVAASVHRQADRVFHVLGYQATWLAGQLVPAAHDRCAWARPENLLGYDLLPADIDLARQFIEKGVCPRG